MRKNKFLTIMVISMAIALFTGCGGEKNLKYTEYEYSDAAGFSVGEAVLNGEIEALNVDWMSGEVKIEYGDDGQIKFSESANMETDDSTKVHYRMQGKTLIIKFCASGEGEKLINLSKKLTVSLPADCKMNRIDVTTENADVYMGDIDSGYSSVVTGNGSVEVAAEKTERVVIGTGQGSIDAELKNTEIAQLTTMSGSVDAVVEDVQDISAVTASGAITLKQKGKSEKLRAESAEGKLDIKINDVVLPSFNSSSGNIKVKFKNLPAQADVRSTSGKISIQMPKDASFTASVKSAGGDFSCDFEDVTRNGKTYTRGDGSFDLNLFTTSGNIKLKPIEEKE